MTTTRHSVSKRRGCATGRDCRGSWRRSSRRFCGVDGTRQASRGCGAPGAARSGSWPSRASRGPQRGSRVGVEGARVLSLVRRPPHDRTGCTPGRPCVAARGAEPRRRRSEHGPLRGCGAAARPGWRPRRHRASWWWAASQGRLPQRLGGAGEAPFGRRPPVAGPRPRTPAGRGSICSPGWRSRATGRGGSVPSAIQRVFCSRANGRVLRVINQAGLEDYEAFAASRAGRSRFPCSSTCFRSNGGVRPRNDAAAFAEDAEQTVASAGAFFRMVGLYGFDNNYSSLQASVKEHFVHDTLKEFRPRRVLDVGCNTGQFSAIATAGVI